MLILTCLLGMLLTFVAEAVIKTEHLEGAGSLGVSSSDLLDLGSLGRLNLQTVSVGGSVTTVSAHGVQVMDKKHRVLQILFARKAVFLQSGQQVSPAAIEVGAHLTVRALHRTSDYVALKVYISPHHRAIGGLIVDNRGVLTLQKRLRAYPFVGFATVKLLPGVRITLNQHPVGVQSLSLRTRVVAMSYPDPNVPGIYLADAVHVIKSSTLRLGGLLKTINFSRNTLTLINRTQARTYTIEVTPQTAITLGGFKSGYADMRAGDHLTIIGKTDLVNTTVGPNPVIAKIIRISSTTPGGVITAIAPSTGGGVILTVQGRHGHLLQIDAPGLTVVYMTTTAGQQTAHVLDLVVGEHIAATGKRIGKFELLAAKIHVYPHQRTVGGVVANILPGRYRITTTDGKTYIIHTTSHTSFTLNGQAAQANAVHVGLHIRVRGYDALHADSRTIPTLIATHVSVTVHHKTVKPKTKKKSKTGQSGALTSVTPTPTPTPHTTNSHPSPTPTPSATSGGANVFSSPATGISTVLPTTSTSPGEVGSGLRAA